MSPIAQPPGRVSRDPVELVPGSISTSIPISLTASLRLVRLVFALVLFLCGCALFGGASAWASGLSSESVGIDSQIQSVNGHLAPTDLSLASASGAGTVRIQLIQQAAANAADPIVALAAAAHLHVAPMLGLSTQMTPSAAATAMAAYVTSFAARYGPNGTFWAANPSLPKEPVDVYEIGDEPNIPLQYVQDETHLHWSDPSAYAQVYDAASAALHAADPSGVALVGGLVDSAAPGVQLPQVEEWLAALNPSLVDGVGYHPYTWQGAPNDLSVMNSDTEALRAWMNGHGMGSVPISINEIGACGGPAPGCSIVFSSSDWGSFLAGFMKWALCTPSLGVTSFEAFYWGAETTSSSYTFLPLVSAQGALTPYGQDYLAAVHTLTTQGCTSPPPPPRPVTLKSMRLQVRGIHVHRRRLIVVVRVIPGSGHVTVVAIRRHHLIRLHLIRRRRRHTFLTFAVRLPPGRWTVVVSCSPPSGYAAPGKLWHRIKIRRH